MEFNGNRLLQYLTELYNTQLEFTSPGWLGVTRLLVFHILKNRRGKRTQFSGLRCLADLTGFEP